MKKHKPFFSFTSIVYAVMVRRFFLLMFLCCLVTTLQAQGLEGSRDLVPKPDTASINQVFEKAVKLREREIDSAILLYQKTLLQSKSIEYNLGIAKALQGLGRCYANKNDFNTALGYLRNAVPYCDNSSAGREVAIGTYLIFSEAYFFKGQFDSCAWYRYEALNEVESSKNQSPATQMRVYGGVLQFWLNVDDNVSIEPFVEPVMKRINQMEQTALLNRDSTVLGNVYFYKAGYYKNVEKYDSALLYCNHSLAINRITKASSPSIIIATLLNMATIYNELKRPADAIKTIEQSYGYSKGKEVGQRFIILSKFFLGDAYVQQKQYQKAIDAILPALAKTDSLRIKSYTEGAHKTLADAYYGLSDFKQAAYHQQQYTVLHDSLMKVQKMEVAYNVEMKYRIADREKALQQKEWQIAEKESKIQTRNTLIASISGILILLSLLGILFYRSKNQKEKLQAEQLRNLQQEIQITGLNATLVGEEKERSRIARDLHDGLGGTMGAIRTRLSAVYRKHKTNDVSAEFKEVMQLLEDASSELRRTAHNLMPEVLMQEGLVKATELYCERVSKGHSAKIHFESWGEPQRLEPRFELAVYRIIQEFVNNVLKHAQAREAIVQITFHEKHLCITIEDDGQGFDSKMDSSEGMGLTSIKERITALNGQLNIDSKPGKGTSVYMELGIVGKMREAALQVS